ncbi:FkbM family methyltransferase [Microcoleus sp. PH2017_24_DOB_U_A]|uniref:FkbM family methyltransferase n=1 Tax=Microcoleus sp. PH2017_24_DOB_U_A TaxID=2798834 RepID=UPI001DACA7DD|nr:FkbM family methyltransferase [Microcoleus sp. PH2017_24_DOB_U_A]MCC3546800.1 FkbM family methyltransferase [Microcoleus sp. PH2017_24_DOB_U_A]
MTRSGSTLQYNICRSLVEKLDIGKGEGFFEGNQLLDFQDQFLEWGKDDLFHVIKIHEFYPKAVEMSLKGCVKFCYIYRDIRDVAASLKKKEQIDGHDLITSLDSAIEAYHKIKDIPNLLIQRYENVVTYLAKAIREVDLFLGLKASEYTKEWVQKECSVENAKQVILSLAVSSLTPQFNASNQLLYDSKTLLHHNHISNSSGAIGVWRVYLEQQEINWITERYKSWLVELKYLSDSNFCNLNLNHHKQGGSGMRVEACCQRILSYVLPLVDEKREGLCIDVGVGTFAFYCEMFSMLGFKTIAVEPLPVEGVRVLCQYDGITLIEACLSDVNGTKTLHLGNEAAGLDSNYASVEPDWFGVSTETLEVQSLTLSKLLLNINAQKVTCLKLDIEGAESTVITKLGELPKAWLPNIVMFEYGGGDSREKGQYGWSPKYLSATMECIRALKECGYNCSMMIDNALDTEARIFELQSSNLEPDSIFYPNGGYGNIIAFRDFNISQDEVVKVCAPYYEKSPPSDGLEEHENVISISSPEELELSKFQLHKTREELEQRKDLLHQTQEELQQYQSQLHQTQAVLEQFQDQMQQAETLLQEYQGQLHQTQAELEQSQLQLHQTQAELEQSESQLHQTQAELEQSESQLHQTQAELEQSQSQLHQTQAVLEQSQSQLHQTQAVLEQSQEELAHKNCLLHHSELELERFRFQLHQTQAELAQSNSKVEHIQLKSQQLETQIGQVQTQLEHSQSKLRSSRMELKRAHSHFHQVQAELEYSQTQQHHTEAVLQQSQSKTHQLDRELKRSHSQIHQVQEESQHYQSQIRQVQEESQHYQSQIRQVQEESQQYQSQLHQVQEESQQYQSQLHQVQEESQHYQSQLHQVQEESQHYQSQLHQVQAELQRSHFQQYAVSDTDVQPSQMPYTVLVWDAWYAYQNGDATKMQNCLQESLKCTPFSKTETLINWLESFAKFYSEKDHQLDTYALTNSEEWKQLMRWTVAVKPISKTKAYSQSL